MSARYPVSPETEKALIDRMNALEIFEKDLDEKFVRGSGPGGQKVNKTSSCVYIVHRPSGIEVKCQKTRSQALNRFHARRELCEQIETQIKGEATKKTQERERIRRQKRRRSRKQKEKILEGKRHRSGVKSKRGKVSHDD